MIPIYKVTTTRCKLMNDDHDDDDDEDDNEIQSIVGWFGFEIS